MDSERWQLAKKVFQQAIERPEEDRRAFVERECGDDADLLAEVLSLLDSDLGSTEFLEVPAVSQADGEQTAGESYKQGDRLGPYRILRKIGEGGMGEVWEAEQREPVRRRVALKVIKRGMDTREVIARFETERQALALMSHRSIARVYDAGSTPSGRPYFAMEYVEGIPITDYCDRHRLSARDRLELLLEVCSAVQHAHQKGIIHRDLKPSNLLVKVEEGVAVPKVIDFGVAKATAQRLTEKTLFTQLGQWVGTPEYMSPEQADLTGLDVDTRTDVYALGVVLYELLVGAKPFDPETLRRAGFDEVRRVIREEDPPRPSTRLSSLGDGSTLAARNRRVDAATLRRDLEGDLDSITMKALEKDRTLRYGSPVELAADVERYLNHEPVLASPPGVVYRVRKFARRHRLLVTAAALVTTALVVGAVATLWQAQIANRERAKAERRFNELRSLANSFIFEVYDGIEDLPGATPVREVVVRRALEYLDNLAVEAQGDRELQKELAAAYTRVGAVQGTPSQANLGDYGGAQKSFEKAVRILTELQASDPADIESRQELARAHMRLAELLEAVASTAEAASSYEAARALVEKAAKHPSAPAELKHTLTVANSRIADIRRRQGRYPEALALQREILAMEQEALSREPTGIETRRDVAISRLAIAYGLEMVGDHAEAVEQLRPALPLMESLVADNPTHAPLRRELTVVQRELAWQLAATGESKEALELMDRAISTVAELQEIDPRNQLLKGDQGVNYTARGRILARRGRALEALTEFDKALTVEATLAPEFRESGEVRRYVVKIHRSRGDALADLGRLEAAVGSYLEAVALGEQALAEDSSRAELRMDMAATYLGMSRARVRLGNCDEAGPALERGRELWQELRDLGIATWEADQIERLAASVATCKTP